MKRGAYWYRAKYYFSHEDYKNKTDNFLYFYRCGICGKAYYMAPFIDLAHFPSCPKCGTMMTDGVDDDILPYFIPADDEEDNA